MISYTSKKSGLFENDKEFSDFKKEVIDDYYICLVSREASLWGRKEVLTGKAKFGILGDGKELPQVAMARAFKNGDWRSGYYRDQTFMMATGLCSVEDYFAQLYADVKNDPFSGGRQMNSHFATPFTDKDGEWLDTTKLKNVSADISCTAGQMARALGIALASKKYRDLNGAVDQDGFSENGNEISFCTIGDSSTSEGVFWETMNAAAVMKVPLLVAVWDDGYGISVPKEMQTVKSSISKALKGFLKTDDNNGIYIYTAKGWDYQELTAVFQQAANQMRKDHVPALVHIEELTQPQGHSTSGSHERYKSKDRLEWEKDHDCIAKMEEWMLQNAIVTEADLEEIGNDAKTFVKEGKAAAWKNFVDQKKPFLTGIKAAYDSAATLNMQAVTELAKELGTLINPSIGELVQNAKRLDFVLRASGNRNEDLAKLIANQMAISNSDYEAHLYSETPYAAINVPVVHPEYSDTSEVLNGYQVINTFFDKVLERNSNIIAFGEDVGQIGDVNQGFAGMQEKYGDDRVFDAGIREWTIAGQAIGTAMRGLRPIAEIQYLDYLMYAVSALSDDLATVRWRSNGTQKAPAIIRTRGHRLEGIWHAGSPLGMMVNSLRGIYICVPRNFVQAAGMYNTLLKSDDPGIVIECLNGYRLKETLPDNIGEYTVPLGVPEILEEGSDITLVTYGSCVREAQKAIELLKNINISVELIDVQTLLPFDMEHAIVNSLKKTNRIAFLDEDLPGAGTAYMMKKVLEDQDGYKYLDSKPLTITAKSHRPPFGSDGDYFTKPNPETIYEAILGLMKEANPNRFPF
jgi:pyruvate/2-oxoglutarate/acetoin dehydrogenase E1 component/TPP-dependent pyruvate/acetoin dehydrogenase alpha subunit